MSEVRFRTEDVAKIRFVISPLWETVSSLWTLSEPGRNAVHLPWIKKVRPLAQGQELAVRIGPLRALVRPRSWLPDFLTPPPISSLAALDDELAVVLATPPEQIRVDVTAAAASAPLSPVLRELLEEPERTLPQLVDGIRDWWRVAIEPDWPRMQALLEADIGYRTRQLAIGGVEQLFDNLHPTLSWAGDRLVSNDPLATALDLNGRGLPLTPSIFATHGVLLTTTSAAPPIAIYPARAVGTLWEQQQTCPGALKRLLGRSRAQLLTYTSSPSTTTQLAARTGLSLGAVSQHLSVLRDAGLVTSHRYRREVNYTATDLGVALLDRA